MPSPYIKTLSKETGKSEKEIERVWKKAKEITSEEFGKNEDDFSKREYSYAMGVVKRMMGIDESIIDPTYFLESDLSAKDYIETIISGNFSIGNVRKKKTRDEENYDDDIYEDDDEEEIFENNLKKNKDDPCWDGYVQLGTKMKDGKEVPNCVPIEENFEIYEKNDLDEKDDLDENSILILDKMIEEGMK